MFGSTDCALRHAGRYVALAIAGLALSLTATLAANAETRTLKIYHVHLRERSEITYKRDGKYLPDGLKKLNWALRDWRENKPTNMDPKLFDLVWEAYRQSGSRDYINVIGGFRSPKTNNMLRSRTKGVAETSQHMAGKAMDFFIPDVPLKKMREIGLKMQIGGVGYYPKSGSPFVHFDTGRGRYWPRMSRKELMAVFPKGNTIHLPADGKPLPGYEQAVASYNKRKGADTLMAANGSATRSSSGGGRTLLAALFGGGREEEEDNADVEAAPVAKPARPVRAAPEPAVQVAAAKPAPAPSRPVELPVGVAMPAQDFDASHRSTTPPAEVPAAVETQVAALLPGRVPVPTLAPARSVEPDPQKALDETLVAALEEPAPTAAAPGQLAYAVPMPSGRPPFETVLQAHEKPTPVLTATARDEQELTPEAIIAAAAASDVAKATGASQVAKSAPQRSSDPFLMMEADNKPIQVAALESNVSLPTPESATAKGGRVVGDETVLNRIKRPSPVDPTTIAARTEIASLITNPERRALETHLVRPVADGLIGNLPNAVFLTGFSPKGGATASSHRFAGKAVNFLPVHKID